MFCYSSPERLRVALFSFFQQRAVSSTYIFLVKDQALDPTDLAPRCLVVPKTLMENKQVKNSEQIRPEIKTPLCINIPHHSEEVTSRPTATVPSPSTNSGKGSSEAVVCGLEMGRGVRRGESATVKVEEVVNSLQQAARRVWAERQRPTCNTAGVGAGQTQGPGLQ